MAERLWIGEFWMMTTLAAILSLVVPLDNTVLIHDELEPFLDFDVSENIKIPDICTQKR